MNESWFVRMMIRFGLDRLFHTGVTKWVSAQTGGTSLLDLQDTGDGSATSTPFVEIQGANIDDSASNYPTQYNGSTVAITGPRPLSSVISSTTKWGAVFASLVSGSPAATFYGFFSNGSALIQYGGGLASWTRRYHITDEGAPVFDPLAAAPTYPTVGMVVMADGTTWDPSGSVAAPDLYLYTGAGTNGWKSVTTGTQY